MKLKERHHKSKLKIEITDLHEEDSMLDTWIGALEQFSINESTQKERARGLYCEKDDELIKASLSKK